MPPADAPATYPASLLTAWRHQARSSPWLSAGLGVSLLAILILLGASIYNAINGEHADNLHLAFVGGLAGFGATALGAVLAVILRDVSSRNQDVMLGFAAGMMLAASSFSLILPGLEAAREITGNGSAAAAIVVVGMGLGVLLMLGLDRFTPHEHESTGPRGPETARINRVWLFVLAITLHNLPEGMAIGVSFTNGDMSVGLPLTSAIAIQDIPEGLAVALALRATGLSSLRAALVAVGSGLMEPLGAVIGLGISTGFAAAYPISMGLAAGAMIFVVSHEVIPETHRNGHQTSATLGLMGGFAVMMFLDTALG
ncbi:ZIP family metal transporter [Pseudomonas sp. RP23018S]|uniref:ZIP family metal transporter n=1 Tax=Pseudomonas sp. RP23018S TaxID=3096037 RepID=UPI002ACAEF2E|nr:ZIP family metal transporter [Pseudomonas sp. RP23018S]MDZ5601493.1 ZIP family metal transporter [Pseudomonas sp. RP23018S]